MSDPAADRVAELEERAAMLGAQVAALEQLLEVQEQTVIEQGQRLALQAQELTRSNAELEMFAYVISHDLQEPLRMISSYTHLLGERYREQLDDKADKYIAYAVGGAKRMQALINDLLAFSRITSRGRPLEPTPLDEVLDEVLDDLKIFREETGAVVEAGPLPVVLADRSQMRQLFQNLLANAMHYRRDEVPPEIVLGAEREAGAWRITVRDNGVGIDPRHHDRIFVIFQRLDRRRSDGTGLGLALCKRIVERHGGRIGVKSQPGAGATFEVTLPAKEEGQA